MKTLIYTALFGKHSLVRPLPAADMVADADRICFSDRDGSRLRADGWKVIHINPWPSPLAMVKVIKCLPHVLGGYDRSVWIDANLRARRPVLRVFDTMTDIDMAIHHHIKRKNPAEEYKHCKRIRRDHPVRIDFTVSRIKDVESLPLYYAGVIWRKHTPCVIDMGQRWLMEIMLGTSRDQITLPGIVRDCGVPIMVISREHFVKNFMVHLHR